MSTLPPQVAHLAGLVRAAIPRIHPGGRIIIGGIWGISHLAALALRLLGLRRVSRFTRRVGTTATIGSALFFRVPKRVPPAGDALVVAPADGVVSLITRAAPPPETGLGDGERMRVSIFLSVLDVHVQFAPVAGTVGAVHYHPGQFLSADLDKASEVNERNSMVIRPAAGGQDLVVTQIAGLIARRIVCDVAAGDRLATGQVYGLIRFGSRLDVYLPEGAEPRVHLGQRAVGGETVLAVLAGDRAAADVAGGTGEQIATAARKPARAAAKPRAARQRAPRTGDDAATGSASAGSKASAPRRRSAGSAKAAPEKTDAEKAKPEKAITTKTAPAKATAAKAKAEKTGSAKTTAKKAAGAAKPRTRKAAPARDEAADQDGRA